MATKPIRENTPEALDRHRAAQRLSYECAAAIRREMREGWTERQTAALMDEYLRDHGVKTFFHRSFAWFGDRTRFQGFTRYWHFMPTDRALTENDVVILDTAPILNGYPADIGYTFSVKPNSELAAAQTELLRLRQVIPGLFESRLSNAEIWARVDEELREKGYDNIHSMYPFSVLGHQLHRVPLSSFPGITIPFSVHSYWMFLSHGVFAGLLGPKNRAEKAGLWAIEPHLGARGFGAKFEEVLVVEKDEGSGAYRARWLDDEVPHVRESAKWPKANR